MNEKIVAVYIRISFKQPKEKNNLEKQQTNSIENQKRYIYNYIQSCEEFQQFRICEFIDDGYSGTNFERPQIKELLKLSKQGKIGCIIVKDFSRFGRNYMEVGNYLEQIFPLIGVRFISINDYYDSEKAKSTKDILDVAFRNLVYDFYSKDLSKKVYSSIGVFMKKGEYLSGTALYGYKNDKENKTLIPDEIAAKVVKRIFEEIAKGKKTDEVAKELNQEGVLVPILYKQSIGELKTCKHQEQIYWDRQKVIRIIHNEKYMGTMIYRTHRTIFVGSNIQRQQDKSKWIRIENHHKPIVEKSIFLKANINLRKNRQEKKLFVQTKKWNPFSCGYCNHKLIFRNTTNPYYRCRLTDCRKEGECENVYITRKELYNMVLKKIEERKKVLMFLPKITEKENELDVLCKKQKNAQIRLRRLETNDFQLYEKYKSGILDKQTFLKQKTEIEKEKLNVAILQNSENEKVLKTAEQNLPILSSEEIFVYWLKEVFIYADKSIEIVWNEENNLEGVRKV